LENLLPIVILPLSKLSSSAVTVWVIPSLFVHVTLVPAVTVSVAGEKDIFTMLTELAAGVLFIEGIYPLLLPQEIIAVAETRRNNIFKYNILFFINQVYIYRIRRKRNPSCALNYFVIHCAKLFLNVIGFNIGILV